MLYLQRTSLDHVCGLCYDEWGLNGGVISHISLFLLFVLVGSLRTSKGIEIAKVKLLSVCMKGMKRYEGYEEVYVCQLARYLHYRSPAPLRLPSPAKHNRGVFPKRAL